MLKDTIYFKGKTVYKNSWWFGLKTFKAVMFSPVAHALRNFLKSAWQNYFKKQYANVPVVNIALPVDNKIPVVHRSLQIYLSFIPLSLGVILFLHQEFEGRADRDIEVALALGDDLYKEAGKVFGSLQSSLVREEVDHWGFKVLRLVDRNRNCYPSLHAQIIGEMYLLFKESVKKYAKDSAEYAELDSQIFKHGVEILESCFTTKQHSVQDIAAGFAALSYKDSKFTPELAERFIANIFKLEKYGLDEKVVTQARQSMSKIYLTLLKKLKDQKDIYQVFMAELQRIGAVG